MQILFVTANRIGDAVLSTGLLAHLIARHPSARITIVCGPDAAPLFRAIPGLDRVIAMRKQRWARHWFGLWRQAIATRWDLVVDLRGSALAWSLAARRRHVLRPAGRPLHRVAHYAELLALDEPPPPTLWTAAAHETRAAELFPDEGPVLALGPIAKWGGKQWPIARFAELADRLCAADGILPGAPVAVFGAADERDAAAPLLARLGADRTLDLVGRLELLDAYACLKRAALFVGNDSALMHMAAASGTPTLGLFGPSREELYAPWGRHAAAVRGTETYLEIIAAPGYDRRRHTSWMESLTVDRALEAAAALWRERHGTFRG